MTICKVREGLSEVEEEDASGVLVDLVALDGFVEDWEAFADSSLLRLAILVVLGAC